MGAPDPFGQPAPEVLFSMNALRRAWTLVRRSGHSPGSDGQTLAAFDANAEAELNRLRQQLIGGTYQPKPVRRYFIKKASGKERPICIWALRDRLAQRVIHDYLASLLEPVFLPCSYGFRLQRSVADAVQAIVAARDASLHWVLDADIADCFGSIPPGPLLDHLKRITGMPLVVRLVEMWLNAPVESAPRQKAGLSQGGVISPLLANMYLHRFDEMMTAALPQTTLVRFADDFVVLCRSEDDAAWSLDVARRSLENLRLRLNLRKTRIVSFDEGFTFLGVHFSGRWYGPAEPRETTKPDEGG